MTANQLNLSKSAEIQNDEEFSIPLDLSDILNICREYSMLGWQIQSQVENIIENGVEESIKSNLVKRESLPFIKSFLKAIGKNVYFGDAISQAEECINRINLFLEKSTDTSKVN